MDTYEFLLKFDPTALVAITIIGSVTFLAAIGIVMSSLEKVKEIEQLKGRNILAERLPVDFLMDMPKTIGQLLAECHKMVGRISVEYDIAERAEKWKNRKIESQVVWYDPETRMYNFKNREPMPEAEYHAFLRALRRGMVN